jgi:Flp pilus assembly protein TadD
MVWFDSGSDILSGVTSLQQAQRASLSGAAMSRGAGHIQTQEYDLAIRDFRLAVAYQPDSVDAHRLMARTYTLMGKTDEAVAAYRKALRADPGFDDARGELATLFLKSQRYPEAEQEFKRLLQTNPSSPGVLASLGYVYMNTGRLNEAETEFKKSAQIAPGDASAHFNLGIISEKLGRQDLAIDEFQRAIGLDAKYATAYSELAYSYLAKGDSARAQEQVNALLNLNTSQSVALAYQVSAAMLTPKIAYLDSTRSTFDLFGDPNTPLAEMDPRLATPGGSAVMSVTFAFNQEMDADSVQDITNWAIKKASGGPGGVYDNGVVLQMHKEINLPPTPISVSYDPLTHRATVYFRVSQNAAGDGVIDPSHWVFKFSGTDVSGHQMDPRGDEWDGFSARSF